MEEREGREKEEEEEYSMLIAFMATHGIEMNNKKSTPKTFVFVCMTHMY